MNKLRLGIYVLTVIFVLSGCNSSKNLSRDSSEVSRDTLESEIIENSVEDSFPKSFIENISGIKFNIKKIEIPDNIDFGKIYTCNGYRQKPDNMDLIHTLSQNNKILEEWDDKSIDEDGNECRSYIADFQNGDYIYVFNGNCLWSSSFIDKISSAFDTERKNEYSKTKEFQFSTSKEAEKQLITLVHKCGYQLDEYYSTYYALDYQKMKELEYHEDKEGNALDIQSKWSDDDNCYQICIEQYYQGIPVYFGIDPFLEDDDPTMWQIKGVVSKNGIEKIQVDNLYCFNKEEKKYNYSSFYDCAQTVGEKYGEILSQSQFEIKRAKLYWIPVKKEEGGYDVHLAWLFEAIENGFDAEMGDYEEKTYTIIDVETGKEIVL